MNKLFCLLLTLFVFNGFAQNSLTIASLEDKSERLIRFVDSLSSLPLTNLTTSFVENATTTVIPINRMLSDLEFEQLKKASIANKIDLNFLQKILPDAEYDSVTSLIGKNKDTLIIKTFQFDSINLFNEFAIGLGNVNIPWGCELYFFKKNKIIQMHEVMYRFSLDCKFYKGGDNLTTVYYTNCSGEGAGVAQFNYCFYKYYDDKILPILNIIDLATWQFSIRHYYIESEILKLNPLTIKYIYNSGFATNDTTDIVYQINDSSIVAFDFDKNTKKYVGNYNDNKIDSLKLLTFYTEDTEPLFINQYKDLLLKMLNGEKEERLLTLFYLNQVKNERYEKERK